MNEIREMAAYVVKRLKELGFTIQRYDSITTNSVYLKLDYGVCNSIRISDHKGKKHLSYRYNLLSDRKTINVHTNEDGYERRYYPFSAVDKMIDDIVEARREKMEFFGEQKYREFMEINYKMNRNKKGFWREAVLV